jgi:hypothetical protein
MTTALQTTKPNITVDEIKGLMESYGIANKTPEEFYEENRRLMWEELSSTSFGACAICDTCGGPSISFCECRYKEFSPNERDMFRFLLAKEMSGSLDKDVNENMADGFDKLANSVTDNSTENSTETSNDDSTDNSTEKSSQ